MVFSLNQILIIYHNNNLIIVDMIDKYGQGADLFSIAFRPRSNIGTDESAE